ncbi:hypothetical protein MTR67_025547 [Solanum verrucosum]|uniref:Uncharacterized protein n=1 Tax=Solanum verrucosum TaxID=315347 RepID=A0AAF0R186_SOLVR|nr:hypothetical protein MTR67_025547 [Solanum verrucosum]
MLHKSGVTSSPSSPIPVNISSSSLRYMDLTVTNLRGVLTESFFLQPNLENLKLGDNRLLKGVLPKIHLSNTLLKLDISFTRISGELPDSIGTLNYLNLHGCQFIPDSIGNLTQIRELWFWGNHFTGHIPSTISKLKHLTRIDLPSNSFSDLSRNEFSGSLPAKVFGNLKAMIELEGEDTGEIKYMEPSKVSPNTLYEDSVNLVIKGNDSELERISTIMTTIDLSSNHFEGHIPMQLRKLNKLEALDLSWNRLTGKIPQELTRMNFLAFLNLSQNHLVGPIPQGPQFNTFGNDSYGGNLDLCGLPLSKQCGTSDSSHVPQPLESTEEGESYFLVDLPGNQL